MGGWMGGWTYRSREQAGLERAPVDVLEHCHQTKTSFREGVPEGGWVDAAS